MNLKIATILYAAAIIVMPISVASKSLLGLSSVTWVDPTLVLSLAAMFMLIPRWGDFLLGELRLITLGCFIIATTALICAFSGLLLRPATFVYSTLREPLRLWLNLNWMLISCWFLIHKPRLVNRYSVIAIAFALSTGIYMDLVVFGLAPAPPSVVTYMRLYFLRQAIAINGLPIPRMGGLFVEAPPFGLFMFSMLATLCVIRRNGFRTRWGIFGITLAAVGVLLSMADQVLLGALLSLLLCLPILGKGHTRFMWVITLGLAITLGAFEVRSLALKQIYSGSKIATEVNGSSIGERSFHFHYGISLLQDTPAATILGIGPGRYGEYAAETGNYPDTVNMQTSEPEILVEWGIVGSLVWLILFSCTTIHVWRMHRILGIGLILGLVVADSFQANWKYESVFLAIATLCASHTLLPLRENSNTEYLVLNKLPEVSGAEA